MATERVKMTAAQYMSTPGPTKPAMKGIDALNLLEDMLARRLPVPAEVRTAAMLQANENAPEGVVIVLEEYNGRVRAVAAKKE